MIRVLTISAILSAAMFAPAASAAACLADTVVLRAATIEDQSGRWEDQDVLIEDGVIVAMGGELDLPGRAVEEIDLRGHILSPLLERDVLVIQTALSVSAAPEPTGMLLAGWPASLQIARPDGTVLAELRNGQPIGSCFAG